MSKIKRILTAALALAMILVMLPAGTVLAAETAGYENGTAPALSKLGSYVSGISNLDGGVAEIVSYDSKNNNAWVVNGATGMLDILDLDGVTCAASGSIAAKSLDVRALATQLMPSFNYGDMTSVSVNSELGIVAVALQAADYDKPGYVGLLTADGVLVAMVEAGVQPDMLTFTPDGTKILVANEGEPREGYGDGVTDPAGSVTIVTLNAADPAASTSATIGFDAFDAQRDALTASGVILGKGNAPSADLEPEYIACDNNTAYVTLQEANAIAVLDLASGTFTGVYSLGFKDLSKDANAIDLVEDGEYLPTVYPDAVGAYMPDGISLYNADGVTYLLTANEGDAREWGSDENEFCNEIKETLTDANGSKAKKVRVIDPELTDGLPEGKSVLFGGRSFSIYQVTATGLTQVFDSGNDFESLTASYLPEYFNCSNDDNDYDSRSPKKGPEAESVTVGTVDGKTYAFVALERIGGIMMYDVTDPANAVYANYINTRDFSENPENADPEENPDFYLTGDVAPEGLYFISGETSPSGTPILLAAYEVSGTVSAYAVGTAPAGHQYSGGVCTVCGAADPDYVANPFKDVTEADYFFDAALWANANGITNGYGQADTFAPAASCTRAQVVTFLWRAAGSPAPAMENPFTDIDENDYFYNAVLWAMENGITNGYGSGDLFNPDAVCTRGQIAAFLWRYAKEPAPAGENPFTDVADTAFYHDAVVWAAEKGITNGYGDGTVFNPEADCTRGQIAAFLYRALA